MTTTEHRALFPPQGWTDCTCGRTRLTYVGWKRHAKAANAKAEQVAT